MKQSRSTKGLNTLEELLNNRTKVEIAAGLIEMRKLWASAEKALRNIPTHLRNNGYTELEANVIVEKAGIKDRLKPKEAVKP